MQCAPVLKIVLLLKKKKIDQTTFLRVTNKKTNNQIYKNLFDDSFLLIAPTPKLPCTLQV